MSDRPKWIEGLEMVLISESVDSGYFDRDEEEDA